MREMKTKLTVYLEGMTSHDLLNPIPPFESIPRQSSLKRDWTYREPHYFSLISPMCFALGNSSVIATPKL